MFNNAANKLLREKYNGVETPDFFVDCKRLAIGEPLDYIIGWKPFLNCKIDLSCKPLIPRPETEFWTEEAIEEIKNNKISAKNRPRILDIFSGSGCVGVAAAKNIPWARVDFAEIDSNLIKQIRKNIKINNVSRCRVFQSDIFSNISGKYDFIFANPPYIARSRENKVQKSVLKYEPSKALFAGQDGLSIIKKFLKEAKNHLYGGPLLSTSGLTSARRGQIWLEFDSFQKKEIEELLRKNKYASWQFYKDQYKRWRFVVVKNN